MKSFNQLLGHILAFLAGGSLPFAFAPFSLFPLAILAPAVLFFLWQNVSPKTAAWRGFLFGLGLFGFGVWWVHISFYQFGGVPLIASLALTAAFILFMALYPAVLGWSITRFFSKNTLSKLLLVLPAAWTLVEWVRGWFLTGFPWLSLGYSQIDSPLNGFAPLLGVYGVSWLTVFSAGLLLSLTHLKYLIWTVSLFIMVWVGGGLLQSMTWTQAVDQPIAVALVQGNVSQEYKWLTSYQQPSLKRYLYLSQAHREADLIIWPETAVPLFYEDVDQLMPDFWDQLATEQTQYQSDFLIGIPVMDRVGLYFNAVMSIKKPVHFYYKRHLVPFGEYIPLQTIFGRLLRLMDIPFSEFSPGATPQDNLTGAGQKIGISICYEDAFGDLIRQSLPSATLLVNVSNDAWFGNSMAPHQHLEMARMRALETGRYLLRATNTGISAVINAQGQIIAQAPQFKITVLRATAQPYQGATPYVLFGHTLVIFLLFLSLGLGLMRRPPDFRRNPPQSAV